MECTDPGARTEVPEDTTMTNAPLQVLRYTRYNSFSLSASLLPEAGLCTNFVDSSAHRHWGGGGTSISNNRLSLCTEY